jgi:hypothetical protein
MTRMSARITYIFSRMLCTSTPTRQQSYNGDKTNETADKPDGRQAARRPDCQTMHPTSAPTTASVEGDSTSKLVQHETTSRERERQARPRQVRCEAGPCERRAQRRWRQRWRSVRCVRASPRTDRGRWRRTNARRSAASAAARQTPLAAARTPLLAALVETPTTIATPPQHTHTHTHTHTHAFVVPEIASSLFTNASARNINAPVSPSFCALLASIAAAPFCVVIVFRYI